MSSANLVSLILIPETEYGKTPPLAGVTAEQIRFTSEALSGTPTVTESTEIRDDRMSAGQVVTGSDIGGDINAELSRDDAYDRLIACGMMMDWIAGATNAGAVSVVQDPTDDQKYTITMAGGGISALGLTAGSIIVLNGFDTNNAKFNEAYKLTADGTISDTEVTAWGPRGLGSSTTDGTEMVAPDYVDIGKDVLSNTLAKAYQDVVHTDPDYHGQSYPGSLVSTLAFSATYGEIMTAVFGTMANGYNQDNPALEQQLITAGGTQNPAGTSNPLNATIDSGLVTVGGEATDFCIESIEINLDNNLTPQNCIGKVAPSKYNLGKASVGITMSIYNADPSYDKFMPVKWTQEPVSISFSAVNADGGYIFEMPAVQLVFPDPSAEGENTQVMLAAEGVAKVGENGESSLRIYRVGAETSPPGNAAITAGAASGLGTTTVTIQIGGGPSDTTTSADLAISITGDTTLTPNPVAIPEGRTAAEVAADVAAEFNRINVDLNASADGANLVTLAAGGSITSIDTCSVTIN